MEGSLNYVAFAIPVFLGSVLLEARIARKRGEPVYNFGTAMSDMATGTVFQGLEVLLKLATFGAYVWAFEHWRLVDWSEGSWVPWLLGMVGVDLLFYWWHRSSHVVNVLWAVHGVHHQSEDYNLAVALRQPAFEPITWFLFYFPLALLGVSPEIYIASYAVDRIYQFFIHTQLVRKLPAPLEWLLNTPSHHRVHHGVQDQYLDKNYGAILIIWDRMFGTFEPEGEEVVYGTTTPLESYNPVWGNLQYFAHMAALAKKAHRLRDKIWAWFAHPAWLPAGVSRDPNEKKRMAAPDRKYQPPVTKPLAWYISGHYLLLGSLMIPFLLLEHDFSLAQLAAGSVVIIASSMAFLGLVERKSWARALDRARGPATAGVGVWLASAWLGPVALVGLGLVLLGVIAGSQRLFAPAFEFDAA